MAVKLAWFITAIMRPFRFSGGRDCMKTCNGIAYMPAKIPVTYSARQDPENPSNDR